MVRHDSYRVAPFGNPWIEAYLRLPMTFRSLSRHGDRQVEHAVPGERERQFGEHALQRRGREPERELVAQQHLGRAAHQVHINRGSGLTQDAGQSGQDAADDRDSHA